RLKVDKSDSIDSVADIAPPLDVFSAAGTETKTIGLLKPAPLTGANVMPAVSFAKNALFEAVLCANAPEDMREQTSTIHACFFMRVSPIETGGGARCRCNGDAAPRAQ